MLGPAQARILVWITALVLAAVVGATVAARQLLLIQLNQSRLSLWAIDP